jgi:RNA polymerase sigma-70 factor, ECF subfamily
VAVERWAADGLPPNPGGWIVTTARNKALDRLRRESARPGREAQAAVLAGPAETTQPEDVVEKATVRDDQLRLIFTCCHPALAPGARLALTLRLIAGLQVPEDHELPARLPDVLAVVYLVFNEGYAASAGDTLVRRELCAEAIRLARLLAALMPDEPEVIGLLALLLLTESRRVARTRFRRRSPPCTAPRRPPGRPTGGRSWPSTTSSSWSCPPRWSR